MAKIFTKSPYFVTVTDTSLTSARLDLYVYTGTQTSSRGAITYIIQSTAYDDTVTFEISELINDFFDITFDGTYTSNMVWADYQVTKSIAGVPQTPETIVTNDAYYGYGYFEDGTQNQSTEINDDYLFQSNTTIYKQNDVALRLPLMPSDDVTVSFLNKDEVIYSTVVSPSTSSTTKIKYVTNLTYDSFENRVLADSGVIEESKCFETFFNNYALDDIDKIVLVDFAADEYKIIKVVSIDDCKYNPYKITFVNKFGALQDIWFFKRSDVSLTTNKDSYKSNLVASGSYNTYEHQDRILTKQGREKMILNSGFYDENYNEVFRQLLLSDYVWINIDGQTLPVNVASSSFNFKTKLNDKLINYTIELEFAYDKINNLR
jgi:hypothetical protein